MKTLFPLNRMWLFATLPCLLSSSVEGALITNGGFESGFSAWSRVDQVGSDGTFSLQTGTTSPGNFFTVPPPPEGSTAAMTDSFGPGSHVLYQDFVVPLSLPGGVISFSLFINNNNGAPGFFTPAHLDFSTPALNQQARVDIITTSADPFSVATGDVLQNLYQTHIGDPQVSGYQTFVVDISPLLQSHLGQTLRLRFSEVDNVAPFNLGVDSVDINFVPEPSSWIMASGALLALGALRLRGSRRA
jgi:hypothetical protein